MTKLKHRELADLLADIEEMQRYEISLMERQAIADQQHSPHRDYQMSVREGKDNA